MTTSQQWITAIDDACAEPDLARSNQLITRLHYILSEALADALGREGGPNFHTWAVWGSRKAGYTIRQEDLDSAIRNATLTAGVVGCLIGAATGIFAGRLLHWTSDSLAAALGAGLGTLTGGWAGRQLAIWSRRKAAKLVLQGNQTVLQDIGEQSARFLELLEHGATTEGRAAFFAGLRPGATEEHGQDRLATAFRSYLAAFDTHDLEAKRAAMIAGNCEIVYHEHIRLEPYIRGAMPLIIRRCATQRWMFYKIGDRVLTVYADLPGVPAPTAARNWARIEQRMRYIYALFRKFHTAPEVFSTPFPEMDMAPTRNSGPSRAKPERVTPMAIRILSRCLALVVLLGALPTRAQSYGPAKAEWTTPIAPFRIADNLYYVGSKDLASYLIVTPAGDILINSSLKTSPPLIEKSIAQLGFHLTDVKILLISHAHFDHDAGSAELLRRTHAKYMVMDADVPVVESGGRKDFAYPGDRYPPAHVDRILRDGDEVRLGGTVLVAHKTPGHTRGCTTWTLRATLDDKPRDVVIVGSWNVNSGFRLVDRPGHPASYPGIAADYERTFATLDKLPCDIFLGAHGAYFNMLAKLDRAKAGARGENANDSVWIDPSGYHAAVAERKQAFEKELKRQQDEAHTAEP